MNIENKFLKVAIDPVGGGLTGIYDLRRGRELLWQGDEKSWTGQDVILFPFIGRMKDGWYSVDGVRYEMPIHGFCKDRKPEMQMRGEAECAAIFRSDAETKRMYPFDFVLTVTRKLEADTLVTRLQVENPNSKPMYFGLGAHPAFALAATETAEGTDTSGNYIDFGKKIYPFNFNLKDGAYPTDMKPYAFIDRIELTKPLMQKYKTMLLSGELPKQFDLVRADGIRIGFDIGRPPVLALWSHEQYGAYVCVEPWWGTPDFNNASRELSKKQMINRLAPNGKFTYSFSVRVY